MNDDQFGQALTTNRGQRGISVSHEDLQSRVGVVTPSVLEVFAIRLRLGVHNLPRKYT